MGFINTIIEDFEKLTKEIYEKDSTTHIMLFSILIKEKLNKLYKEKYPSIDIEFEFTLDGINLEGYKLDFYIKYDIHKIPFIIHNQYVMDSKNENILKKIDRKAKIDMLKTII